MGAIRTFLLATLILAACAPVANAQTADPLDDRSCIASPFTSLTSSCSFQCEAGDHVEITSAGVFYASASCGGATAACSGAGVCEARSTNVAEDATVGVCHSPSAAFTECRAVRAAA